MSKAVKNTTAAAKPEAPKEVAAQYLVCVPFRDKHNWNSKHNEGEDVSHLPKARLDELLTAGVVKKA